MKSNNKFCALCGKEIIYLGFENRIIDNHHDKSENGSHMFGTEIEIKEFSNDTHLNCRIKCARYYTVGLGLRWYKSRKYTVTSGNRTAYQTIEQLKQMNRQQLQSNGIFLFGTPGLGKTLLLAELCKNICNRSLNQTDIHWENSTSIFTNLRASMGRKYEYGEQTVQEKILNSLKVRYLFLDDLGTESATEWSKEILYEAINFRYEERLPIFVSSNLPPQALSAKLGDKLVSRLIEMCRPLSVSGEDMRLNEAKPDDFDLNAEIPVFSYQMARWDFEKLPK